MHLRWSVLFLVASAVPGQCGSVWAPGDPVSQPYGPVAGMTSFDFDGAGPQPAALVAVGSIVAGSLVDCPIGVWDGVQWTTLGTPPGRECRAVTVWNGELVASFVIDYSHQVVAKWTGAAWQALGTFDNGTSNAAVTSLYVYQGNLLVGGWFATVDGVVANNLVRFDGVAWSSLGFATNQLLTAMAAFQGGLWVASYTLQTSPAVGHVDTWINNTWVPIGSADGIVRSLAVRVTAAATSSFACIAGTFTTWTPAGQAAIAANKVARFAPSTNTWTSLGANFPGQCSSLLVRATGLTSSEIVATQSGTNDGLWQWNGTTWVQLGPTLQVPGAVHFHAGVYHVAGYSPMVVRLQGNAWTPLDVPDTSPGVPAAVLDDGAAAWIGGTFGLRHGAPTAWSTVGSLTGSVLDLARAANGDVLVAGTVSINGGPSVPQVVRWDGATWSVVGGVANGAVNVLLVLPNGDVVAGGAFTTIGGTAANCLARWNGNGWQAIGGGVSSSVLALAVLPNGDLFVGGMFATVGNPPIASPGIARWNALGWAAANLGFVGTVGRLAVSASGELYAGLEFPVVLGGLPCCIAVNNGVGWSGIPAVETPTALVPLPGGDLLVGGLTSALRRWDGTLFGAPMAESPRCATLARNGDVLVGGDFDLVGDDGVGGGVASRHFARLVPQCPATATTFGVGCASSGGANTLAAVTLPWVDATFRARGTGLPTNAIVLALTSVTSVPQGAVPLALLLGEAAPGCDLLVAPDILQALVVVNGTADTAMFLPNTPPLVGVTFFHQLVPFAAGGGANSITSTNALELRAGTL